MQLILVSFSCSESEAPFDCTKSVLTLAVVKVKYADCGLSNGEVTVEALDGKEPYKYSMDENPPQSNPLFINVRPGLHDFSVTDGNGCLSKTTTFMGNKEPFPVNSASTPSGCGTTNGTITVTPLGGVPPYKYQLGENNDNYQTSNTWTNLRSGTHSIWVEDVNKCFFGIYVFVPSGVSYKNSIVPILEAKCNVSGCHGGDKAPDLRTYNGVRANASKIKSMVLAGTMPPNNSLTPEEILAISCWVDDKTPNN